MEKQPPLINIHQPYLQLILILTISAFSYLFLFPSIAILLAIPIFHISTGDIISITDLDKLSSTPTFLSVLKFLQVFSELGLLAPALIFAFLMGQRNDYLKFSKTTYLIPTVLVIGIILLSQPIVAYLGELNSHLQLPSFLKGIQDSMRSMEDKADALTDLFLKMSNVRELLLNILIMAVITAICEEAFFRGTLQQILLKWVNNKHVAVWVTGAIFSAVHFEFFGFLPRMVLGAMLGYIFLWSGNLWYSIMGHMVNNGLAVIAYYLYQSKIISYNPDSNDTGPAWLILISTSLFIGLLFIYHKYFKHHSPEEEDIVKPEA